MWLSCQDLTMRIDPLDRPWRNLLIVLTACTFVGRIFWLAFDSPHGSNLSFSLLVLLSISTIGVVLARPRFRWTGALLMVGSLCMLGLATVSFSYKSLELAQLLEFGIQVSLPALLYFSAFNLLKAKTLIRIAKVAIACTFVGHGLYAVGVHGDPGHFMEMTRNFFELEPKEASDFLIAMGLMDFAVSILIFMPRFSRIALAYAVLWGGATALARILAVPEGETFGTHFAEHWYETLFRLPHGGLPLLLFLARKPKD